MLHFAGPGTGLFPDLAAAPIACKARTKLPDTAIEVVVRGPCVAQLSAVPHLNSDVAPLAAEVGIEVCACQNSMRVAGIEEAALAPGVRPEPAAVAYLASGRFAGAAYLRIRGFSCSAVLPVAGKAPPRPCDPRHLSKSC